MATDPEAIKAFLARRFPPLRQYKDVPPEKLLRRIEKAVGVPYKHVGHPPRKAQLEGLAYALARGRGMPLFGMRMGKTKLGLDFARMLRLGGQWDEGKAIVFANAPGGVKVWEDQAKTETTQKVRGVRSGPTDTAEFFKALDDPKVDIIVVAWSTLQEIFAKISKAKGAKRATAKLNTKLLEKAAQKIGLCIIDEIHKVANPQSIRFRIASRLIRHCDWRLGYTGTLVGRDPYKVWAPIYLIDEGELLGESYTFFKEAMAKPLSPSELKMKHKLPAWKLAPKFDKKGKMKLLEEWIASFTFSYELKEVVKLNIEAGRIELKMGDLQRKAYAEIIAKAEAQRGMDEKEIQNTFVRLRQISAGFVPFIDDDGKSQTYYFPDAAKPRWLEEFFADYDGSFQMLIFHEFIPAGNLICRILAKAGIAHRRLGGKIRGAKADAAVAAFQAGDLRVLCIASKAGSEALELGKADYLLFYDSPVSPITRQQAEARPLNRGERLLVMDDLVCSPTDEKILGFLKQGQSILRQLSGGGRAFSKLFALR